jgi:V8-like Glu-specific endopeptidase
MPTRIAASLIQAHSPKALILQKTIRIRSRFASSLTIALTLGALLPTQVLAEPQNIVVKGRVAIYSAPTQEMQATSVEDIAAARPMPLPTVDFLPIDQLAEKEELVPRRPGTPGFSPGSAGTGQQSPVTLPVPDISETEGLDLGVAPEEYGTQNQPYTTARVNTKGNNNSKTYPYSAAGKLYFKDGASSFVCSASLIKRGVIVTAAHCVAQFGANRYYTNFQFVPALYKSVAPFGTWNGAWASVPTSYLNGTDTCAPGAAGIVCRNDVAVIRLAPQSGAFPGTKTGWLGYGWNGLGFTADNLALVSQLGYPVSHDRGLMMHRTDSQAFVAGTSLAGNTIWGSRQTGGSSGGPAIKNLGIRGSLTTPTGSESDANLVVGVTSWGYVSSSAKQQGASPFLSTNIVPLVNAACASNNPACQ